MAISFNPFFGLTETKAYPHARALRTTLWQKIKDTFHIYFGYFYANDKPNNHAGIFDYLLLGAIPLLDRAYENCVKQYGRESKGAGFISGTITVLYLLLLIPRLVFAALLTGASLIPILFTHLVTWFNAKALKKDINDYKLTLIGQEDSLIEGESIEEHLEKKNTSLEDICEVKVTPTTHPTIHTLQFFAPTPRTKEEIQHENRLLLAHEEIPVSKKQHLVLELSLSSTSHAQFFHALKELNVGNVQGKQEAEERAGFWI